MPGIGRVFSRIADKTLLIRFWMVGNGLSLDCEDETLLICLLLQLSHTTFASAVGRALDSTVTPPRSRCASDERAGQRFTALAT